MNHTRPCPICASTGARTVHFRQRFAAVEGATPLNGYDVTACGMCGGVFADGIPDQRSLDRYYASVSKYEYHQRDGAESEFDARRLKQIARLLATLLPHTRQRVVDIGCASGRLLAELGALGFTEIEGIDPSPACAAAAARLHGVRVRNCTLVDLGGNGEQFDVAILVGVLEHLVDIDESLAGVRRILPVGGLVYLEVPDITTFANWPNAPYQDFSTEHVIFFSPDSLCQAMARRGFKQVWIEQNHREQAFRTTMSNISAMFERLPDDDIPVEIRYDETSVAGLDRYLEICENEVRVLEQRIALLADSPQPILIWGVGTHTGRLMATSRLAEANIAGFIESNARYHGRTLDGYPIFPPSALLERNEPVLISSRVFQQEISAQIRAMGCDNDIITLYDTV